MAKNKTAKKQEATKVSEEPFMFRFREFVEFSPEDSLTTNKTETMKSTGTAGREDDYDEP